MHSLETILFKVHVKLPQAAQSNIQGILTSCSSELFLGEGFPTLHLYFVYIYFATCREYGKYILTHIHVREIFLVILIRPKSNILQHWNLCREGLYNFRCTLDCLFSPVMSITKSSVCSLHQRSPACLKRGETMTSGTCWVVQSDCWTTCSTCWTHTLPSCWVVFNVSRWPQPHVTQSLKP